MEQLVQGLSPEERGRLLAHILQDQLAPASGGLSFAIQRRAPKIGGAPKAVRGFKVRLDLLEAKPPIWRRLMLPGDIELPALSDVILAAMGWAGGHLHEFSTGQGYHADRFLNSWDEQEGEPGTPERGVRLDQLVSKVGDTLFYTYDFGDDWSHRVKVEAVLPEAPGRPTVIAGRRACPPEDVGGIYGYDEAARWVESGYSPSLLPDGFEDAEHGHDWLGDWDPADFEVAEADDAVSAVWRRLGTAGVVRPTLPFGA